MVLQRYSRCQKTLSSLDWHQIGRLSDEEILVICSLAYNFASGLVGLSEKEKACLQKYKKLLIKLAATHASKKEKKKILNQNKRTSAELIKTLASILNCKIKREKVK